MLEKTYANWPYQERSTRNCVYAKVCVVNGKAKIYCGKGRHLAKKCWNERFALALDTVMRSGRFVSEACVHCEYFSHDRE